MTLSFVQLQTQTASTGEDWITTGLIVAFVLSATITAGLLLRSLLFDTTTSRKHPFAPGPAAENDRRFPASITSASSPALRGPDLPAWVQHVSRQQQAVAGAITDLLADYAVAINQGDQEGVSACQTASLNGRFRDSGVSPAKGPLLDPVTFDYGSLDIRDATRAEALVTSTSKSLGALATERFTFVVDPGTGRWQIETIEPA